MNYDKLSTEDLLALKENRLEDVSTEGLLELKGAERKVSSGRKNYAPTVEEMKEARAGVEPTTGEALAAGYVEGTPFLKDAVAAFDGVAEAMESGQSFEQAYGNYKENLDDINQDLTNAESQSPVAFTAGEIGGTAGAIAAAGAGLGAAGAGKVLTKSGMAVASGALAGAAIETSQSRDRSLLDPLEGAAIGAVSELGGQYIMRGAKKAGKYLMDKADDVGSQAAEKILGIKNKATKKNLHKHLKITKQKESEFLNDVLTQKMKDSDELVVDFREAPERILDKVQLRKEELGEEIGSLYKKIDAEHDIKVDLNYLKQSLKDDILPDFQNSDDPGMQEIGSSLMDYIDNIGSKTKVIKDEIKDGVRNTVKETEFDSDWTLPRIHKLQTDITKRISQIYKGKSKDVTVAKEQERRIASSIGKHIDGLLSKVSTEGDDVINQSKKLRKQFGNIATIEETLGEELFSKPDSWQEMLKSTIGLRGLVAAAGAAPALGPGAIVIAPIVNKIANSPKTPLYVAQGIKKLGQVTSAAPTGRIATRLHSTASMMSTREFEKAVLGSIGEINLQANPIKRNKEDVIAKQQDIRNVLKLHQPEQVSAFDEAVGKGGEEISILMDGFSKIPEVQDMFEPGVGFDNKVYDPKDKAQLEHQLKGTDMPAAQRMEMLQGLRNNGIIPDFNSVVLPEPKKHVKRPKKVHDY